MWTNAKNDNLYLVNNTLYLTFTKSEWRMKIKKAHILHECFSGVCWSLSDSYFWIIYWSTFFYLGSCSYLFSKIFDGLTSKRCCTWILWFQIRTIPYYIVRIFIEFQKGVYGYMRNFPFHFMYISYQVMKIFCVDCNRFIFNQNWI